MLVAVAASSTAVCLQPSPEPEGCWCPLRLISEGSALQKGLGFSVVFCGDAVCLEHVVGVTVNTTSGNTCYQGQDLLRRPKRK